MTKVMIIEDDPMVLAINKKFLSKVAGFEYVAEATSLDEAKTKITSRKPDLILLDVFFPVGKGIDLLKWLRTNDIDIDAILITADKSSETVAEALRYGAVDYLIKPFKFERFEEALLNYKLFKERLNPSRVMDQSVIDKIKNLDNSKMNNIHENQPIIEEENLNHTLTKIMDYIETHLDEKVTAQFIAKKLGISRITARRYLDDLEKTKFLNMELEYGTVGRPKNIYYRDKR
ncbi:MAG: response regulator [Vallitaleaceae bacterium]|nr:response regulator [Vallitaleaceae bacterium]